jgi:hypothetical protein
MTEASVHVARRVGLFNLGIGGLTAQLSSVDRLPSTVPRSNRLVLDLVLIVAPKLFIEPGTKAPIPKAFERERPRIVNNFVATIRIRTISM